MEWFHDEFFPHRSTAWLWVCLRSLSTRSSPSSRITRWPSRTRDAASRDSATARDYKTPCQRGNTHTQNIIAPTYSFLSILKRTCYLQKYLFIYLKGRLGEKFSEKQHQNSLEKSVEKTRIHGEKNTFLEILSSKRVYSEDDKI